MANSYEEIDRERARRRGLRTALRVAGLVGVIGAGIGGAQTAPAEASDPQAVDDAARNLQARPMSGCFRPVTWGPPAPVPMREGALGRLRAAVRALVRGWAS